MIANYRQAVAVGKPEINFVGYIESSGTQYIDTGFIPDNNTRVIVDIKVTKAGTYGIFGGRQAYGSKAFAFWVMADDEWKTDFGGEGLEISSPNTLDRVVIDKNKNVCYLDFSPYTNTNTTFESPSSLTLFAVKNGDGQVDDRMGSFKLYSCQIYDNGILVRDYAPALDPEGVACLYDKISEEYVYNSGTGSFLYPQNQEVNFIEYIESSGTQYIDTGFKANQNTRVIADIEPLKSNTAPLFGSRVGAGKASFLMWVMRSDQFRDDYGSNGHTLLIDVSSVLGRIIIDKNKNATSFGSNTVTHSVSTFQMSVNLLLFATTTDGSIDSRKLSGRLYSFQIYDNEDLVRDYAPALDPQGVPCLYDKVSEEYIYNSGTGSFTAGPTISGEGDANTLLLLHGEDISDSSVNNVSIQNHGVVSSDARSKFGGKSLIF